MLARQSLLLLEEVGGGLTHIGHTIVIALRVRCLGLVWRVGGWSACACGGVRGRECVRVARCCPVLLSAEVHARPAGGLTYNSARRGTSNEGL